jgi:hypothetical protein
MRYIFHIATWCGILFPLLAFGQSEANNAEDEAVAMTKQIYRAVSSEAHSEVNWDSVRSFFIEEAVIVLRTSRNTTEQFTLDGFIQDFKDFYKDPEVRESGFKEEVLKVKSHVYHDVAFIGIVYAASIPDSGRPPQRGVDFWLLGRKNGSWKVVAVTNELIPPGDAFPEMFE